MTDFGIRGDCVYISWQTRKMLGYAVLTMPDEVEAVRTIDGLTEKVMADWLKANHPKIVEHVKKQVETDAEFRKQLVQQNEKPSHPECK